MNSFATSGPHHREARERDRESRNNAPTCRPRRLGRSRNLLTLQQSRPRGQRHGNTRERGGEAATKTGPGCSCRSIAAGRLLRPYDTFTSHRLKSDSLQTCWVPSCVRSHDQPSRQRPRAIVCEGGGGRVRPRGGN